MRWLLPGTLSLAKQGPGAPELRGAGSGPVASQRMESSGPGSKPLSAASPALAGGFFTWEALFVFYAEIVYQLRDKVA